ncbi:hypothetical protein HU200_003417 [Digitaria exilis]|uniref:Uncharacterized protein n=1 Tax=Digitaria exilis TaxID=1010633 RepID=A0A835FU97_9POAL|nr:hypothetical protein HU200_003417 [Digitaria exilis]
MARPPVNVACCSAFSKLLVQFWKVLIQFVAIKIAGYQHAQPGFACCSVLWLHELQLSPCATVYRRDINNCEATNVKRKMLIADAAEADDVDEGSDRC